MIINFSALHPKEKRELISETASQMGVDPIVVEKDIWVSTILKIIFTSSEMKDSFIYKGGTSLSKVYDVIHRFSEDIDLIMDWRLLGIGTTKLDPWDQTRSKTKQDQFNKSLRPATNRYLKDTFIPWIRPLLPSETEVFLSKSVDQGVEIHYPALFSSSYIPNRLLLEIGPLASWIPSVWKEIMPDVSRHFPNAIGEPPIPVRVTTAERTFWEKTTIAHQIAYNKKI